MIDIFLAIFLLFMFFIFRGTDQESDILPIPLGKTRIPCDFSNFTHCKTTKDCQNNCISGKDFSCKQNICVPKNAKLKCGPKSGGINVWGTRGCECLCAYSQWASNPSCDKLNPWICEGGKFTWKGKEPTYKDCTCPSGKVRLVDNTNRTPHCINKSSVLFYSDTMTRK